MHRNINVLGRGQAGGGGGGGGGQGKRGPPLGPPCYDITLAANILNLFCRSRTVCRKLTLYKIIEVVLVVKTCKPKLHRTLKGVPTINE